MRFNPQVWRKDANSLCQAANRFVEPRTKHHVQMLSIHERRIIPSHTIIRDYPSITVTRCWITTACVILIHSSHFLTSLQAYDRSHWSPLVASDFSQELLFRCLHSLSPYRL